MRCPSCGSDNPPATKFCIECGVPLTNLCPQCGVQNLPWAKFCGECGTSLAGRAPATTHGASEAERRQLTVMFCDLVGSTSLSGQLDPEDLREVIRAYQDTCANVIQHFDGRIAQYLGDGLLVYFGYPQAHEDDPQRAVQAALGMLAAMGMLNTRLQRQHGLRLAIRVGIHTGLVVVGDIGVGGRHEQLALGETPNVAARIQGMADPDTVAISDATYRLIQGYFACQPLGEQVLRGMAQPMAIYRVLRQTDSQSRLGMATTKGLTPLVGREQEAGLLLERWERVKEGLGQVVVLSGEAGIGKSRLVQVMQEQVDREGYACIEFRCSPYHTNSPLYPVIAHLERLLGFQPDEAPESKLARLEEALVAHGFALPSLMPLMAALLSLPLPERFAAPPLSPQRQRHKTHEALAAWLLAEAESQPVLAVWEHLHWADPSTLELLGLLLDQIPTAHMLTLLTCRSEFRAPWVTHFPLTHITLGRLGRRQAEDMVASLIGGKALPAAVLEQVIAKTDGVPLFIEELVKMILDSGLVREEADRYVLLGPLPPLAIPSTLHDSLMARLDRLTVGREVARIGAVLGREFSYEVLQAVTSMDEVMLQRGLVELVEAELAYQRSRFPQVRYSFKHALVQDTAYQSLLKSTRQQYHQRIAQVLESKFPETVASQPELLGHHYTEAGLFAQAVPYWQHAGRRALERSAHQEAISHFARGLEALRVLPESPECARQELDLQLALGPALMASKGYAAPDVARVYSRARELCQRVGEPFDLFQALFGLWLFYIGRGELQVPYELGEQLLNLAQRVQTPAFLLEAHMALGITLYYQGQLAPARVHFEQGFALYDPQQHRSHAFLYGHDPGVGCRGFTSSVLWLLGYPDQALKTNHEALALARELSHPFSLSFVLGTAARLHENRREARLSQEHAEALVVLSREQNFPHRGAMGAIWRGWALVEQGQNEEGLAQMHQGLLAYRATEVELEQPYFLALLAKAYGEVGQIEKGLQVVAEAFAVVGKNGVHWLEAELCRLRGELLLQQAGGEVLKPDLAREVEACFHQARDIAQRQRARSLELRAAMSLSRLWQRQGKQEDARQVLAEVYDWFTEGFDTADLQEAKALLDTLA